jgi:hypothetical protein
VVKIRGMSKTVAARANLTRASTSSRGRALTTRPNTLVWWSTNGNTALARDSGAAVTCGLLPTAWTVPTHATRKLSVSFY